MSNEPLVVRLLIVFVLSTPTCRLLLANDDTGPVEAKLIGQGDTYLVHLVPVQNPAGKLFGLKEHFGVPFPNTALTHTSTKTGKMQYLFVSGRHSASGIPKGITIMHYREWRLLGVSVTNDCIVLATWRSADFTNIHPPKIPKNQKGTYEISIFNAIDGAKLTSRSLPSDAMPEAPPRESYDQGQLRVKGNEISILDQILRFDGKELLPVR